MNSLVNKIDFLINFINCCKLSSNAGGLGLNATQYARFQEVIGNDGAIGVMLGAHQSIGLKVSIKWLVNS